MIITVSSPRYGDCSIGVYVRAQIEAFSPRVRGFIYFAQTTSYVHCVFLA